MVRRHCQHTVFSADRAAVNTGVVVVDSGDHEVGRPAEEILYDAGTVLASSEHEVDVLVTFSHRSGQAADHPL